MSRPFLVVGAMKSGTTTLESLLANHPDASIAVEKETTAFDGTDSAEEAAGRILCSRTEVAGEVSTGYMQSPWVTSDPRQAVRLLGADLRVLAVLRDPLTRAISHWRHWEQLGRNPAGLTTSLTDPESAHVAFSRYHEQLVRWADVLPEGQLHVLRLEDYALDPREWQRSLTEFLRIEPLPTSEMVTSNEADTRVVARGLSQRISRSSFYRKAIRPLVPSSGRKIGTRVLGGQKGGGAPTETPSAEVVERFRSLIAADAERLRERWPHATWTDERG
ncbi:sulfotransferase domain-containing protein [Janibacter sp. G349]|uniref:sulfotransferase domain-containing protein n=1 Tax=Janibacter sp. G349 TaxID=3405424 RepID=UPI003B7C976A